MNNQPAETNSKQVYGRLLSYARPYWKVFALAIVGMIGSALTEAGIPVILKPILDASFVNQSPEMLQLGLLGLVLLFLGKGLASFTAQVGGSWVGQKVVHDMRCLMFNKLTHLPHSFFNENSSGSIISKITYNTTQVATATTEALIVIVRDSITVVALLAWLFYLDWQLTLTFLVITPFIATAIKIMSVRLRKLNHELQDKMGLMTQSLNETTPAMEVIKTFGGEEYEQSRFDKAANLVRRFNIKTIIVSAASVPVVQLLGIISLVIVVYIISLQAENERMQVDGVISFFAAMAMLFSPIKRLTKVNATLQRGLAAADSLFEFLDTAPEKDDGTQPLTHTKGHIQLKDVVFRYPNANENALNNISLEIQPGETIALVGGSGSGKSTLASLIPRFQNPSSGSILIDGQNLQDIKLKSLRSNIAIVSQKVILFNDSVAANIAYGASHDANSDEIKDAAKAAHALDFIEQLTNGFNTSVGENGSRLSGGQRQRIAIARALLKDAPILIMDEATSALDSQSEQHVQAALEELRKNRTAIIIAHRLSTIENADRIIVMDKGQIIETGSHQELLTKGGAYAKLYQAQFSSANKEVQNKPD